MMKKQLVLAVLLSLFLSAGISTVKAESLNDVMQRFRDQQNMEAVSLRFRHELKQPGPMDKMLFVAVADAHDHLLNLMAAGGVSAEQMKEALDSLYTAMYNLDTKDAGFEYWDADGRTHKYERRSTYKKALKLINHGYFFKQNVKGNFDNSETAVSLKQLVEMLHKAGISVQGEALFNQCVRVREPDLNL